MTGSKKRERDLKTLNLQNNATDEDIKLAYRQMAKKTHPDLHRDDPEASKKFLKVKNAYNDLKNSNKLDSRIRGSNYKESWVLRSYESHFRETFNHDIFFNFERRKPHEIPISPPETFVDLKELIKRRRKNKYF